MKYSKQNQEIMQTLKENVVHPSADFVYNKLKENNSSVSLATVYRNLNKLAQNGHIKKIEGLNDKAHFDHNTFAHYHFKCTKCNKIFDVPASIAPEVINKTEIETGFQIDSHDIVMQGLCKTCRER